MHWPQSNELIILGAVLIAILYTIRFFAKKTKNTTDIIKFIWVIAYSYFYTAQVLHWPSLEYGNYAVKIIALYWLYEEGPKILKKGKNKISKSIYIGVFCISIFTLIIGSMFKIMHWPYANLMVIIGYLGFIIWLLTGDSILKISPNKFSPRSDIIDDEILDK